MPWFLLLGLLTPPAHAAPVALDLDCKGHRKNGDKLILSVSGPFASLEGRLFELTELSREKDGTTYESKDHHGLRLRVSRDQKTIKGEDRHGKFKAKCHGPGNHDDDDFDDSPSDVDWDSPFST